MTQTSCGAVARSASRRPTSPRSPRRVARQARRRRRATTRSSGAGRSTHKEDFWRELWEYGGVIGTPGDARARRRATGCRARAGSPTRGSTSRRTCSSAGAPDDDGDALVFWGEDKVARRLSHAQLHALASRASRGARRARHRRGRPRRGVHAEHAGDDRRDARRGVARRDLVVVLAGLRRAGRGRPLRPDRAARALHGRRLLLQRQGGADPRQGARHRRAPAVGRARRRRAVPRGRLDGASDCRQCATRSRGTRGSRRSCRGRSTTRRCRSIIRSTSCTRRARPACRSASCTAPAARCCST